MVTVNVLVEGMTDEPVAKRLLQYVGLEVGTVYGRKGKMHVLERLLVYNKAADYAPWFVIVDLDNDAPCPLGAIGMWLPDAGKGMRCRIAVRAIEAWLMADRENMAQFLGVSPSRLQHNVESDPHPKETLINIARHSRYKSICEDLVPRQNSGARVGPLYAPRLTEFIEKRWRPAVAANESRSLLRCINALETLKTWHS